MPSLLRLVAYPASLLLVAAVYFLAAYFGLKFDAVSGFATLVWPPTGIAVAVLLLYGQKYAPAVFLGATVVNYVTGAPVLAAVGIGIGNMLEAVVAERLLRRHGFENAFPRVADVLLFGAFAGVVAPLVSATLGTTSLWLGDVVSSEAYARTWGAWWLGDAMGAMIVGTFLLAWLAPRKRAPISVNRLFEAFGLFLFLLLVERVVFLGAFDQIFFLSPFAFLFIVPLLWAAIRFGTRGTATAVFFISVAIVWMVAFGEGTFAEENLRGRVGSWLFFIALVAGMKMVVAAAFQERLRAKEELVPLQLNFQPYKATGMFSGLVLS